MDQIWPTQIKNVELNDAYEIDTKGGKHLRINMVESIDGVYTIDGRARELSSEIDRAAFQVMRKMADVLIVGATTARVENYKSSSLPIAVISSSGDFDLNSDLFSGDHKTIIFTTKETAKKLETVDRAEIIECSSQQDPSKVDLTKAVSILTEKGFSKILCEGGPTINAQLLEENLVDELCLSISPKIVQGVSPTIFHGPKLTNPSECIPTHIFTQDDFIFVRYSIVKKI